jgi:hypothetical protein
MRFVFDKIPECGFEIILQHGLTSAIFCFISHPIRRFEILFGWHSIFYISTRCCRLPLLLLRNLMLHLKFMLYLEIYGAAIGGTVAALSRTATASVSVLIQSAGFQPDWPWPL